MANLKKISEFAPLDGATLAIGDFFPVVDISVADADKNKRITIYEFVVGMAALIGAIPFALTPLAAEPADPTDGMIVMADRTNWDPLGLDSGGAYLTMYLGSSSGWGAITGQLD
jgi:hypothetical protein